MKIQYLQCAGADHVHSLTNSVDDVLKFLKIGKPVCRCPQMSVKANLRSSAQTRFSKLLTKPPESFRWNLPTAKIVESASLDYRGMFT